ncbi:MAG TPA: HAMP domain-containing sensor histidine kinase [Nitrosarchaeum sp.]|nr:HAMP domain-containing sensor histidine kinase [Nitrosarchaeum sp.]
MEIIKKPNKFSTNNKIAFISVISSLSVLYLINNIVSIEYFSKYISLPVYTIIPGMLIILSIWALSRADKIQDISKKSLFFLVLSFVSWFAAEQTWNLYEHVLAIDPYPSIADFFYISAPILMFISLIIFLQSQRSKIKKTDVIFANVVSILILIPMLVMTFQSNSETEFFEITVAMIYPIVDTALLIPAIIAILFSLRGEKNSFWAMILIGIIIFVIADDLFLFLVIYDGYYDGNPVDILWLSSYLVWTFAIYNLIHRSKKIENGQEQNDDYKYQTNRLTKYGINIALILIVCTTIAIIVVLNYFWSLQADSNFMLFFSLILITLLVVFSSIIVLLNSKLTKALEIKSVKINELSNELIKSERLSAIGELAARLSHDLRNPLSVIKGSVEITMLRNKDTFSTQDNDAIQRINNAIIRMTSQIEDVLNYVKQTPIEKKDVSVLTCIKNSISEIPIPTKIKLTVQENDVWIYADEVKLEVVFSNLIRNAVEAIGNDVGSIEIKIQEDEKQVIVDIIDSGIGIKGDDINQIFEPLYTTKQTGTGLGLVSCKNIVEQHGGKISVKNNPTTFTIRLPKKSTD